MEKRFKAIVAGSVVLALAAFPSMALAETGLGEAAATEITLIIPQATVVGVSVIGVFGVVMAIMTVIGMIRHI